MHSHSHKMAGGRHRRSRRAAAAGGSRHRRSRRAAAAGGSRRRRHRRALGGFINTMPIF